MARKIKDYEWASVSAYMAYIDQVCDLVQLNLDHVYSFKIPSGRLWSLSKKKETLIETAQQNCAKLCVYVQRVREEVTQDELNVLRGMYKANMDAIGIMREHITRIEHLIIAQDVFDFGDNGDEYE